jgi:hypothetical protein
MLLVFGWKKAAGYTLSRMPMDVSGRDLVGMCKSIMFNQIKLRDLAV